MKTENLLQKRYLNLELVLKLNKIFLLSVILFSSWSVEGQSKIDFEALQKEHKGQPELILADYQTYYISKKKSELSIKNVSYTESLVLNTLGASQQRESFLSSQLSPVTNYNAYLINQNNKKVPITDFHESQGGSSSIFYDDIRKVEVVYSGVEPGTRKVLEYETEFKDPNLLHRYIFNNQYPVKDMKFEVQVDNDIQLGYKIINDTGDITFNKEVKRKKTIYTWEKKNTEPHKWEPNSPSYLYLAPHIAIYIKDADNIDSVDLLGDVPKLFKYYRNFIKDLNNNISPDLQKIAPKITQNQSSEEEKVKAIYYWVKDNIKYIAYENGYEGFIPREANIVFERKFGDCKDMASIIQGMATSIGIENVKLTWIGTRDIPYTYEELPTPATDNHMIACYVKGDDYIFLDATDSQSSYPLPSSFIQGKQALIAIGEEDYKLITVPIVEGKDNFENLHVEIEIQENKIQGKGNVNYTGLSRTHHINSLNFLNETQRFNALKNKLLLGNNKFILEDVEENNIADRDQPYELQFSFNLDNYVLQVDNEQFINLFLKKYPVLEKLDIERVNPYEFKDRKIQKATILLQLNENQLLQNFPEKLIIDNHLISFHASYSKKQESQVELQYSLELKTLYIQPKDFLLWNETIKSINDYMENSLTIKILK